MAISSVVALLMAMALFAFMMSPRGSKIGGGLAILALLAAILAAGMTALSMLLPQKSKVAGAAHEAAVIALMAASIMIAANGIPLLIAWL